MKVQFILNDIIYTMNLSEWVKTIAQLKNSIIILFSLNLYIKI